MSRWPNNRLNALGFNPYRYHGLNISNYVAKSGENRNRYLGEFQNKTFSTPTGYGVGYAQILQYETGTISNSADYKIILTNYSTNIQEGREIGSSINLVLNNPSIDLFLTAELAGTVILSLVVNNSDLGSLVSIGGSSIITLINSSPLIHALSETSTNTTLSVTTDGYIIANGHLSGNITPYTTLSPENLASAVWSTIASEFNDSGTMGNKLNLSSAGGIDIQVIRDAMKLSPTAGTPDVDSIDHKLNSLDTKSKFIVANVS